ncbi:aminopeptidase P family protein [Alkalispirochaeta alkalica]|uniref:aminopeptidase P family protein n=1 Tax=Alkalispirochaeta alkalica TaxID=46356 RepID=UPI000475BC46|nr:aminopeptidase P family protein [Alkalispirochaeta alkalica]
MTTSDTVDSRASHLQALRAWMARHDLSALIVPSADPHQGEYVPSRFMTRAFVSGFAGSAGTVVITPDEAGLWTDSRYFLEAEEVLRGTPFRLFRLHSGDTPDYPQWLASTLGPGSRVAVDGQVVTLAWHQRTLPVLAQAKIDLVAVEDPFDQIWQDRPGFPAEPVYPLSGQITGRSAREKLESLQKEMEHQGARSHVISTLDDIAWILNLRGSDVPFNPVFLAYLTLSQEAAPTLFTAPDRVTSEAREALAVAGVELRAYGDFGDHLRRLPEPVLLDPERTSWTVASQISPREVRLTQQPSTGMKARKNRTEAAHLREAHRRDGLAIVRFLAWLERAVERDESLNELDLAGKLQEFRRADPRYVSDSFSAISGINGNGAIVHYSATPERAASLTPPAIYLIDSGAQYQDGTTDITRTVAITRPGETADLARAFPGVERDFTLVLKGHIALATLIFPEGTPGREIDAIARTPLWRELRNYGHGTGHGVGFFLNVHEGPQRIAPGSSDAPLQEGMICSNEPGLYRPGLYGIRIENLVHLTTVPEPSPFGTFLRFETLSLCPIDRNLIDRELLTPQEREWLDQYHRRVCETLGGDLSREDRSWLEKATAPIS